LAQRRHDLEDQTLDPETRAPVRAGTTVIARVDGQVEHVITKPLPLSGDAATVSRLTRTAAVRQSHEIGVARLTAIREFWGELDRNDALAAWLTEPAVSRLSFASLHAAESLSSPATSPASPAGTGADHG
jgi:hypothetical protein